MVSFRPNITGLTFELWRGNELIDVTHKRIAVYSLIAGKRFLIVQQSKFYPEWSNIYSILLRLWQSLFIPSNGTGYKFNQRGWFQHSTFC
jgi:hypothetical protein